MQLIRNGKGCNDFVIAGLTVGKLLAIQNAMLFTQSNHGLGEIGFEVLDFLNSNNIRQIESFGESHTDRKITIKLRKKP